MRFDATEEFRQNFGIVGFFIVLERISFGLNHVIVYVEAVYVLERRTADRVGVVFHAYPLAVVENLVVARYINFPETFHFGPRAVKYQRTLHERTASEVLSWANVLNH